MESRSWRETVRKLQSRRRGTGGRRKHSIPTPKIYHSSRQTTPVTTAGTASTSAAAAAPPPAATTGHGLPEPDIELLAALLKNPDTVYALTSGQGKNLTNNKVSLVNLVKTTGVGLAGIVNEFASVTKEVQVPVPDPNPSPSRHLFHLRHLLRVPPSNNMYPRERNEYPNGSGMETWGARSWQSSDVRYDQNFSDPRREYVMSQQAELSRQGYF